MENFEKNLSFNFTIFHYFFILNRLAEEEPRGPWKRIEDVAPKLSRDDRPGRGGNAGRGGRKDFGGSGWDRPGMSNGGPVMNFGGNFGGPPMGFVQSNQNNWGTGGQGFGGPPQNQNSWPQQQNQGGWGSQQNNQPQGWQSTGGWSSQGQQNPGSERKKYI